MGKGRVPKKGDSSQILFWLPYTEMGRNCREHGVDHLWIAATLRNLAVFRRLGWPLEVWTSLHTYRGRGYFLTRMSIGAVEASIIGKATKAETYRIIVELGRGAAPCKRRSGRREEHTWTL